MNRIVIGLTAALLTATGAQAQAQTLAIVHAKAYATPGAPPIEDATIVVQGGRILSVGAGEAVTARDRGQEDRGRLRRIRRVFRYGRDAGAAYLDGTGSDSARARPDHLHRRVDYSAEGVALIN